MNLETIGDKYVVIDSKFELHYYKEHIQAHIGAHNIIVFNELQEFILLQANEGKSVKEIFQMLTEKYEFDVKNKVAQRLFCKVLRDMMDIKIISLQQKVAENRVRITGERGQTYPFWISCEITNKCCFKCPHCYKEAGADGEYLDIKTFYNIIEYFKGKTAHMVITGGEALIHPMVREMLVLASKNFKVHLLTNGYYLENMPKDILEKLESVQISLYGFDDFSYEKFTGAIEAATRIESAYKHLRELNIQDVKTTLIVTPQNVDDLDKYFQFALRLGVKYIDMGVSIPVGRALSTKETLYKNDQEKILIKTKEVVDRYRGRVNTNDIFKHLKVKAYGDNKFHCQAGKTSIVISEKGKVRPCLTIPFEESLQMDVEHYVKEFVCKAKEPDYKQALKEYNRNMQINGGCLGDMKCAGFCKIL